MNFYSFKKNTLVNMNTYLEIFKLLSHFKWLFTKNIMFIYVAKFGGRAPPIIFLCETWTQNETCKVILIRETVYYKSKKE